MTVTLEKIEVVGEEKSSSIDHVAKQLRSRANVREDGLWVIHGKTYDLTEFAKHHPGGEYILMVGQGRDCSELFESLHAPSNKDINAMLRKYEVKSDNKESASDPPLEDLFLWNEDGFYSVLKNRVKEHFKKKSNHSHKASWFVWSKLLVMSILYVYSWWNAATTGNIMWAILSGILTEMIGFNLMHDSSHNAVSSNPNVNYYGTLWSSWMFWNNWKWIQHHCYGHHSYTGIHMLDPDVVNAEFLVRKHERSIKYPPTKYQGTYSYLMYLLLPNQHVGQMLIYFLSDKVKLFQGKLFGLSIKRGPEYLERDNFIVMTLSALWHIVLPLFFLSPFQLMGILFFNYTLMGISYFLNVAPNHDTLDTSEMTPNPLNKIDWGEHQLLTTSNHTTSGSLISKIVTQLWGGMNFQIEHHLFPSINHCHYPEIAKIVEQTAKEFNIPYNNGKTWIQALQLNAALLKKMSKAPHIRLRDWLQSFE